MAVRHVGRWSAHLFAAWLLSGIAGAQSLPSDTILPADAFLPSDVFLSRAAADRAQPPLLGAPARALRVATLEWPYPDFALPAAGDEAAYAFPPPLVLSPALPPIADAELAEGDPPLIFGPSPATDLAYAELALDLVLALPGLDGAMDMAEGDPPAYGPDFAGADEAEPSVARHLRNEPTEAEIRLLVRLDPYATELFADEGPPLYHDPAIVFGFETERFPPLPFEYAALPATLTLVPLPLAAPSRRAGETEITGTNFAMRLGLEGPDRARAEKCLAEAIYFESRGEPKRGQIAVAQVVMNRVVSGFYPADVCRAVYQNAHRRNACQFTFACDYVKDVVREPDMWVQAKEIAAGMLDGQLWLESVGRATHYHAYWVRPSWVREMRKLDRIGVHTFYRPRRWDG